MFNFDVHEDIRLTNDATIEKDEVRYLSCREISCLFMLIFCCYPLMHKNLSFINSCFLSFGNLSFSLMLERYVLEHGTKGTNIFSLQADGNLMIQRKNGANILYVV